MSEVIAANIQLWRQKALDGTITDGELREATAAIRKERVAASETSSASRARKTAAKTPISSDDLLSNLMEM